MANVVIVDGHKFISVERLLECMVMEVVDGTYVDNLYITDSERDYLIAYSDLCNRLDADVPDIKAKLKNKYVSERFCKRTIGG